MTVKLLTLMLSLFLFAGIQHDKCMCCNGALQKMRTDKSEKEITALKGAAFSSFPADMMPFAQALLF